jgi:2-polyprenyl-6-methoxyphenol hydroxylase-like FAD-dependent oxidoreductase
METARPYPAQRVYRADGGFDVETMSEAREPTPDEPYAMPLLSPQFLTERALRERLEALGGRVEFGLELTGFVQDAQTVTATLTGPDGVETLRCRYMVGTDGGRSAVRHTLGVEFPGQTLGVRAMVADVRIEDLSDDAWHRWGEGLDQIGLCPLWGTDLFQLQAPIPAEGEVDLTAEGLNAMVAARTGRTDLRVLSVAWASAYSMNARLADRYRVGRVFLAGDAAHIHPPTGGQGLNTSLQDAYNLGWKLAAVLDGAPDALLDSYEAERRPVAAEVLGLSTRLLDAAKAGRAFKRGRETNQMDIGYPDSPLSFAGTGGETGIAAGDRAPDAPVKGGRLVDRYRGPHWTLLASEAGEAPPSRTGLRVHAVQDDDGHIRDAYGLAAGEWVLVRPDGYVAGVGAAAALTAHLDRILG